MRWLALTLCALALAAPAEAKPIRGKNFVGFLQYANPYFIQGYVGLAPSANQPVNRDAVVLLFVQRVRGTQVTPLGPTPVRCDQSNPEGEAAMGLRCGFAIPLASSSNATAADAALKAGDRLRIKVAGVAGGGQDVRFNANDNDTKLFDFQIGQADTFLKDKEGNNGAAESPGNFYFQGRIQQIRADSIRGYAVDDLFLAGRPANNVNIFNPTTVRLIIYKRSGLSGWTKHCEILNLNADRTTETPLVSNSPSGVSNQGTAGTWPFGWVANLSQDQRLDNVTGPTKYYLRLEEARWRGGGTPIDARVVEFAGKDAVAVIRNYDWKRDGSAPAEVQLQGDLGAGMSRRMVERLETRALLEREEFLRRTPASKDGETSQLRPAPDRLYGFTGDTDHGERGFLTPPPQVPRATGAAQGGDNARTPVSGLEPQGRAVQPEINVRQGELSNAGGYSRRATNQVWVEAKDAKDAKEKFYVYEWAYADPSFEKYVTTAFETKRKKVDDIIDAMKLPPPSQNTGTTVTTPAAPVLGTGGTPQPATTTTTQNPSPTAVIDGDGFVKVYTKGDQPQSWDDIESKADLAELKTKRDAELPECQKKLDREFNNYELEFEVAALSPDQRTKLIDQINQQNASTTAPAVKNPFNSEAKSQKVKVKLQGDWNQATWDGSAESKAKLHPLCVTARYMYERAFQKLKKEFDDRQKAAANAPAASPSPATAPSPAASPAASPAPAPSPAASPAAVPSPAASPAAGPDPAARQARIDAITEEMTRLRNERTRIQGVIADERAGIERARRENRAYSIPSLQRSIDAKLNEIELVNARERALRDELTNLSR